MTASSSHVEQQVQARIAAAKIRVQAARQRRDELTAARRRGLAHRHAQKLRNQAPARDQPEPPRGVPVRPYTREDTGTAQQGPTFCDGCNGTADTHDQITHNPWCTVT